MSANLATTCDKCHQNIPPSLDYRSMAEIPKQKEVNPPRVPFKQFLAKAMSKAWKYLYFPARVAAGLAIISLVVEIPYWIGRGVLYAYPASPNAPIMQDTYATGTCIWVIGLIVPIVIVVGCWIIYAIGDAFVDGLYTKG